VNGIGSPIPSSGWISFDFLISNVTRLWSMSIYLIAHGDVSGILRIILDLSSGVFSSVLELSWYSLAAGLHPLSFYAVSGFGSISDGFDVASDFLPDATATLAGRPILSASPLASQSPALYPGAYPSNVPIRIVPYSNSIYDIYWLPSSQILPSLGSVTTLPVGGEESSVNVLDGERVSMNDVTLVMRNLSLTPSTILIMLQLPSVSPEGGICDVAVYADTGAANTEQLLIRVIGSAERVYWSDD
jgi:hypothetical protein